MRIAYYSRVDGVCRGYINNVQLSNGTYLIPRRAFHNACKRTNDELPLYSDALPLFKLDKPYVVIH